MENAKEVVTEFEGRINAGVRRQEKLDVVEEQDFREELLEKYIAKILYKWSLKISIWRSWGEIGKNWSQFSQRRNLEEG